MKRLLPLVTESDKKLPYYLVDAACGWKQEHVVSPRGYLYQWIQCLQGEGELLAGGQVFRIKAGSGMLLFKNVPHEYYAITSEWIVDWAVFDGEQVEPFLRNMLNLDSSRVLYLSKPDAPRSKLREMMDLSKKSDGITGVQGSGLIYSLLTELLQYASKAPQASASLLNVRLKPLLEYIDAHFARPLTLDELAAVMGVTPQYLCTLFKKTMHLRIFQYIQAVRIQKSKELLLQSPYVPIKKVALLTGFEDANYFSSLFKKHEQLTPNQFRRLHHGKIG